MKHDGEVEYFEIVDDGDRVIGTAPRSRCHGDPSLVHRVAHVIVVNRKGELLLQKRSLEKDIQPGKWDTSVGGHLNVGEGYEVAARREMKEELGIEAESIDFLYAYPLRNAVESENVRTYLCRYDGPIFFDREEITEVRYWSAEEIEHHLGRGMFTPNFEDEYGYYRQALKRETDGGEA
ncbi:MAG: NUDIX domain-containing protein [bacterium]|nr:NUDIX domain-containing protein [bacterium]